MLGTALVLPLSAKAEDISVKAYAAVKAVVTKTDGKITGEKKMKFHPKGASIATGVKIGTNLRIEAEFNHRERTDKTNPFVETAGVLIGTGFGKTELSIRSYLLNGYVDFHNDTPFTPYAGIGIGMAKVRYDYTESEDIYNIGTAAYVGSNFYHYRTSKTKYVYQIGAGVSYDINEQLALDINGRYVDYGSFTDSYGDKLKTTAKELAFGIRYSF